jgi:hypothetical protein
MNLIEIFLPLADNDGNRFAREHFENIEAELADRFGGVTAYPRAPARGLWKESDETIQKDDIIIYEVMSDSLDRDWWASYRTKLAALFRQERLVMRSQSIELL